MSRKIFPVFLSCIFVCAVSFGVPAKMPAFAQSLPQRAVVFLSPDTQTILEGSVFDVSVFLNSMGGSVNAIDLNIKYPPDKLEIIRPSAGQSLISLWLAPPSYSNTAGEAQFSGAIPNGVITQSGLITSISFRAKVSGTATVSITPDSKILANDGMGTAVNAEFGRAQYTITPKPPEGVTVTSDTHPFSSQWYNNNNLSLAFEKPADTTDFSYILDNNPFTVPDNTGEGTSTSAHFQNLADGLWYFHIKALKQGVWGPPSHFLFRIDTTPPLEFIPRAELVVAGATSTNRSLIYFLTTDALSGIDHYEIASIDKSSPASISPIFVWAESPYPLPDFTSSKIIVRAIDKAGNIRDSSLDVSQTAPPWISQNYNLPLVIVIAFLLLLIMLHYLFGHRVILHTKRILRLVEAEHKLEKEKEEEVEKMLDRQVDEKIIQPDESQKNNLPS